MAQMSLKDVKKWNGYKRCYISQQKSNQESKKEDLERVQGIKRFFLFHKAISNLLHKSQPYNRWVGSNLHGRYDRCTRNLQSVGHRASNKIAYRGMWACILQGVLKYQSSTWAAYMRCRDKNWHKRLIILDIVLGSCPLVIGMEGKMFTFTIYKRPRY